MQNMGEIATTGEAEKRSGHIHSLLPSDTISVPGVFQAWTYPSTGQQDEVLMNSGADGHD